LNFHETILEIIAQLDCLVERIDKEIFMQEIKFQNDEESVNKTTNIVTTVEKIKTTSITFSGLPNNSSRTKK
jgi:hypothetical protein